MISLTIKIPAEAKEKLSAMVKELGGEIIVSSKNSLAKKSAILKEIKQGLKEVKEIRTGKSTAYTMSNLFDGR